MFRVTRAMAAVVCLGGVLTGCGSGGGHGGYAAVGAPGVSGPASGGPTGDVTFVPLDGGGSGSGGRDRGGSPSGPGAADGTGTKSGPGTDTSTGTATAGSAGSADSASPGNPGSPTTAAPTAPGARHGRTTAPAPPPGTSAPPAPAALTWSDPERADGAHRWCDEVTVGFRNSGGSPVRSGTVTFGTHIIDALGIDWATVRSTQDLPVPIAAGARTSKSWTVCVESMGVPPVRAEPRTWGSVPLGMHVETRDLSVQWG
ncbi:hypothetical protein [Streptomyces sp. YIM S03343]